MTWGDNISDESLVTLLLMRISNPTGPLFCGRLVYQCRHQYMMHSTRLNCHLWHI